MTSPLSLKANLKMKYSQPACQPSPEPQLASGEHVSGSRLPGFFQNKIFVVFINQALLIEYKTPLREISPQQIAHNACKEMGIHISSFTPELYDQINSSIVTTTQQLRNAAIYFLLCKPDSLSPAAEAKAQPLLEKMVSQLQVNNYNDLKLAPELRHGYNKVTSLPTPGFRFHQQENQDCPSPSNGRQHYLLARCAKSRRSFFCPLITCLKQSKHSGDLRIHFRTHTGEKPFQCQFCTQRFLKKTQLHQHVKESTASSIHKCPHLNCERIFATQCQMLVHVKAHNLDTKSEEQGLRVPVGFTLSPLNYSMNNDNNKPELEMGSRTEPTSLLLCPLCPKRFSNSSDYHQHLKLHQSKPQSETAASQPLSFERESIQKLHKILLVKHLLIYCYELQMQQVLKNAASIGDSLMSQLDRINVEPVFATEPTFESSQSIESSPLSINSEQ